MNKVSQIMICSAPRSGSTFLDMMLGGHDSIASLGEFSFLGKTLAMNERCGCGELMRSCGSWQAIFDRVLTERGVDLKANPYGMWQWDTRSVTVVDREQQTRAYLAKSGFRSLWMRLRQALPAPIRFMAPMPPTLGSGLDNTLYLFDLIREAWGKESVVDSSKNIYKALEVYRQRPDSTKIVLLVRDGRGVLNSRRKSGVARDKSVKAWMKYYSRASRLLKHHVPGDDWTVVRYEDLAARTDETAEALFRFLGLPFDPRVLQIEAGERHVVNGNQGTKSNREFGIKLDEKWRAELGRDDLIYFSRMAGDLNRSFGYPDN